MYRITAVRRVLQPLDVLPPKEPQYNKTAVLASQSQKKANDAMFKGLDLQQNALNNDAATLEQLQSGAQSATGRMQAIQYANQLASHQANQLLQIRGLLIAQQNAIATKMQADADREALSSSDAQVCSGITN